MLFGTFKTTFFDNLETLWEYRQNNVNVHSTITRMDIGVLVYGSKHSIKRREDAEFPLLRNSIQEAFDPDKIRNCWSKRLGLYPKFTRAALNNKDVRHEVVVDSNGDADDEADPESSYLKKQNDHNQLCCEILHAHGYNGQILRMELAEFSSEDREALVTKPRSRARQDAIEGVKAGTGVFFQRTGGSALNDDDVFMAQERKSLREQAKELQTLKEQLELQVSREAAAFAVISLEKLPSKLKNPELKILIDWKLGKPCPSKIKNKPDRLALWLELKDQPVNPAVPWSSQQEGELAELEAKIEGNISIENTAYGRKLQEERLKARSILLAMSTPERHALMDRGTLVGAEDQHGDSRSTCDLTADSESIGMVTE